MRDLHAIRRPRPLALALLVLLAGTAWAGSSGSGAPSQCGSPFPTGCEEWVARLDDMGDPQAWHQPNGAVMSPDGTRVFVAAELEEDLFAAHTAWAIHAIDAATGALLWRTVHSFGPSWDNAVHPLVTPDGSRLVVAGRATMEATMDDIALAAYDAASGALLWTALLDGGASLGDYPRGLALSADGALAFVTGESQPAPDRSRVLVAAYDVATGAEVWRAFHSIKHENIPSAGVLHLGDRVVVGGYSSDAASVDAFVSSFRATDGAHLWTHLFADEEFDAFVALAGDAAGERVFAGGSRSVDGSNRDDAFVAALSVPTGTPLWMTTFGGPEDDGVRRLVVDSAEGIVYGAGGANGLGGSARDMLAFALWASDGKLAWETHFQSPVWASATDLALGPDGRRLYVTGQTTRFTSVGLNLDVLTVAFSAESGAPLWQARYDPAGEFDSGVSVLVEPDGERVLAVAESNDLFNEMDPVVLSYFLTAPPVATLDVHTVWVGVPRAEFKVQAWDPDGTIVSWSLDADGDGAPDHQGAGMPPLMVEHTYAASGSYTARLRVVDDEGGVARAQTPVTV